MNSEVDSEVDTEVAVMEWHADLAGFGVGNYRSFDEAGFVLDHLRKLNFLIGKNNCGKSNVLRAISLLHRLDKDALEKSVAADPKLDFFGTDAPVVIVGFRWDALIPPDLQAPLHNLQNRVTTRFGRTVYIRIDTKSGRASSPDIERLDSKELIHIVRWLSREKATIADTDTKRLRDYVATVLLERGYRVLSSSFKKLLIIENFREIKSGQDATPEIYYNGERVIALIKESQIPRFGQDHLREDFERLERFVQRLLKTPELKIMVTPDGTLLLRMHGKAKRLPLASFGTGVHQLVLLCAALATHHNHIVCIEEPEIHIHPELQREFLRFLREDTDNIYFISTHSNTLIDCADEASLYHVRSDGFRSIVERVAAPSNARDVLRDLGFKASDLLQSNCVIWVEGPSDRIYLNKWLSLVDSTLQEGLHYSILFYGGDVRAHFSVEDEPDEDLVEVLRINSHVIFLMDRDTPDSGKKNVTKQRICNEVEKNNGIAWITTGREVENYIAPALIAKYSVECGASVPIQVNDDMKIVDTWNISDDVKRTSKVEFARAIVSRMVDENLDHLDLRERMIQLVKTIRAWNGLSLPDAAAAANVSAPI